MAEVPRIGAEELDAVAKMKEAEGPELDTAGLVSQANAEINKYSDQLKVLPDAFRNVLHNEIVAYFRTSPGRFEQDEKKGLSGAEFKKYKEAMLQKLNAIIDQYAPTKEALEARNKQQRAAKEAAETAGKSAKTEIKDTKFSEANLSNPQGIRQELEKFSVHNDELHTEGAAIAESMGNFQKSYQEFEKAKSDWGVYLRGGTGFGLFETSPDPETEHLKSQLESLKTGLEEKIARFEQKKRDIAQYSQKLNDAGDFMRRQKIDERDGKLRAVDAQGQTAENTQRKNEEQYRTLDSHQQKLFTQRDALATYHDDLVQQLAGATESKETIQVQSNQLNEFNGHLGNAIQQIDEALAANPPPPQKEELEAKKAELASHQQTAKAGLTQTKEGAQALATTETELTQKQGEVAQSEMSVNDYLKNIVGPSLNSLSSSIKTLELAKLKNGTQREQIEAQYGEMLQTIDAVDSAVADNVIQSNLANEQLLGSLKTQKNTIDGISIERPNLWDATVGLAFGKAGEGIGLLTKDVISGMLLDPASAWLKDVTKNVPVVNVLTEVAANIVLDLPSGVIEGAGELVGGVFTIVAHPVDTLKGVGALVGLNPDISAGDAWSTMGKALIAYENFEKGQIGKGVGKVLVNVLTTATGLGAAFKGAQGAALTYKIANAAGSGALKAGLKATGTGARIAVTEFSSGLAKLPGEALAGVGKLAKAPAGIAKLAKETATLSKTAKLEKAIGAAKEGFTKVSKTLEETTIGGRKISEIQGLTGQSSKELGKLSGEELAHLGLKDTNAIRDFMRYREALGNAERVQSTVAALSHQKDLVQIAPELEAALKLKGDKLKKFISEFNQKHPEGFPEKSYKIVRESKDGIIAFNEKGALQLFEDKLSYQSSRSRFTLRQYIEKRYSHLDDAQRVEKIAAYEESLAFISDTKTQAEINKIFEGLDGIPEDDLNQLRHYIEKNGLEQHFCNPEQYVSHGFDHSLNVKHHMENALRDNPVIAKAMMENYGLTKAQSELMLGMVAVFHDFGYPEVGELGKALHAVTGAKIAVTDEFLVIMKKIVGKPGVKFDELMFDFKNAILYHSADKVEIFREAKIKIAHGEFILDSENIVDVISRFYPTNKQGKIEIYCSEATELKMKQKLTEAGMSYDDFEFRRPRAEEVGPEGKFRGRAVDLAHEKDKILGIQYKEVTLLDDPMNFMIRLTDNCDMTVERFSELQRTKSFQEIYRAFGPLEGQHPPTGKLLEALEKVQKGSMEMADIIADPKFKPLLDKFGVDTNEEIGRLIKSYKEKLIDEILSGAEHKDNVSKFGDRIKEIGMKQNSESIRHFGGCESVKGVKLCCGHHLTVTVDQAKFTELNQTKVTETTYLANGQRESVRMGIGEYQIWRAYEAYRSLKTAGKNMIIIVVNENGQPIVPDVEKYFLSRIIPK